LFLSGCASNPEPVAKVEEAKPEIHLDLPSQGQSASKTIPVEPTPAPKAELPVYPGAEEIQGSEKTLQEGDAKVLSRSFRTTDSPKDVARYFRAEGTKIGKLNSLPKEQEGFQVVDIEKTDGGKIQIAATRTKDGATLILVSVRTPITKGTD
jgi:hypothetical protein